MTLIRPGAAQTRVQDDAAALWAASHLADLPTVTRFTEKPVRLIPDAQGRWVRSAFTVTIRLEEPQRFMIHLHAEASLLDVQTALQVIERAKACGVGDQVHGDDLWDRTEYGWRWMGCVVQDGTERHDRKIRECAETACVEQFHEWNDDGPTEPCMLEPQHPADWCSVYAFRFPGRDWETSASAGDPSEGPQGLQEIQAFAAAYERMQAECDRLNNQTTGVTA